VGLLPDLLPAAAGSASGRGARQPRGLVAAAGERDPRLAAPLGWLGTALGHPKTLLTFVASSLLLSANWITYIWAVSNGHVVDSSLGYFITPLVNVALGYFVLAERPRRAQWLALAIAAAGVVWLTVAAGSCPGSAWCSA
jgi:EamA domain-containing membrane protein RarD